MFRRSGESIMGSTRRSALRWLGATAVVGALTTLAGGSMAGPDAGTPPTSVDIQLTQLVGGPGDKSVPADWPMLAAPPWNTYPHYEVSSTKKLSLPSTTKVTETLIDGSTFDATYLDTTSNKVEIVLRDASGATLSKGKYGITKGQKFLPISIPYKTGNLVVAVTVL